MFAKILVPLDGSPHAERALATAALIARSTGAQLDVASVHEPLPFTGFGAGGPAATHLAREEAYLIGIADDVLESFGVPATHAVMHGGAAEKICERAREANADLIVMTTHGRTGVGRALLGSVADEVLRGSTVPVLMLRSAVSDESRFGVAVRLERILVPLDGSAFALDVLPFAAELARSAAAAVDVLHVVPRVPLISGAGQETNRYSRLEEDVQATKQLAFEARQVLSEAVATLTRLGAARVERHVVVDDDTVGAILSAARSLHASAVAMSTHGRGASRLLVGSVADQVIRGSSLPILLRRPIGIPVNARLMTASSIEAQLPALSRPGGDE